MLAFTLICGSAFSTFGQGGRPSNDLLGNGLSISGGLGHFAIRDEYISDEKYSGSLPYFEATWLRGDDTSAYRLGFEYRSSSEVRNYNVTAGIAEASLNLDYLNYVGKFSFIGRDVFAYLGPSGEIYIYYRQQNIANGGIALFDAYSFALFFSGAVNSTLVMPVRPGLFAELSGELDLVSFGGRLPNLYNGAASIVKFVSLLSGARGSSQLLLRYDMNGSLSISGGYRFEICQSASWNYLISASDNIVVIVTYRL